MNGLEPTPKQLAAIGLPECPNWATSCAYCGAATYTVTAPDAYGDQRIQLRTRSTWRFAFDPKGDDGVAEARLVYELHICDVESVRDLERYRTRLREGGNPFPSVYTKDEVEKIAQPYDVPCRECGSDVNVPCWNRISTKNPKPTRRPHETRVRAGLRAKNLAAANLGQSTGWKFSIHQLEPARPLRIVPEKKLTKRRGKK